MHTFLIISFAFFVVFGLIPALYDDAGEAPSGPTFFKSLREFVLVIGIAAVYLVAVWLFFFKVIL